MSPFAIARDTEHRNRVPAPIEAGPLLDERQAEREAVGKTGWPAGMLQDDCRGLSKWLASRPDARMRAREAAALIVERVVLDSVQAAELRDHDERYLTRTASGLLIGSAWTPPPPAMTADAELMQAALLRGRRQRWAMAEAAAAQDWPADPPTRALPRLGGADRPGVGGHDVCGRVHGRHRLDALAAGVVMRKRDLRAARQAALKRDDGFDWVSPEPDEPLGEVPMTADDYWRDEVNEHAAPQIPDNY